MTDLTLFVGLDVHKKTISVAMVEATAGAEVRFYGTIANTPDAIRGLCKKLTKDGQQLHFCYEAGPCRYGVQRQPLADSGAYATTSALVQGFSSALATKKRESRAGADLGSHLSWLGEDRTRAHL